MCTLLKRMKLLNCSSTCLRSNFNINFEMEQLWLICFYSAPWRRRWQEGTWFCSSSSAVWKICRTSRSSSSCSTCGAPSRSSGRLGSPSSPLSAERLFLPAVTSTLPSPHQVSFLHAGLHQHRVEAVDVAEIQPLDPSVPAGGCGRRLVITFTGKAEALTTVQRYLLLTVCRSVLVSSGGRDPVPAHLWRDASVQPPPPCDAGTLFKLLLHSAALPGPHVPGWDVHSHVSILSDSSSLSLETQKQPTKTSTGLDNVHSAYIVTTLRLPAGLF